MKEIWKVMFDKDKETLKKQIPKTLDLTDKDYNKQWRDFSQKELDEIEKENSEVEKLSKNAFRNSSIKTLITRRSKLTPKKDRFKHTDNAKKEMTDAKWEKIQAKQYLNYTSSELANINYNRVWRSTFFKYPMLYKWDKNHNKHVKILTTDIVQKLAEYFDIDSAIGEIDMDSKMVIPRDIPTLEWFCAYEDFTRESFQYYLNWNPWRWTPWIPMLKAEYERAMLNLEHVLINAAEQKVLNPQAAWKHLALIDDKYKPKYEFEANINVNHNISQWMNLIEELSPDELLRLASWDKEMLSLMNNTIKPIEGDDSDDIIEAEFVDDSDTNNLQSFNKE